MKLPNFIHKDNPFETKPTRKRKHLRTKVALSAIVIIIFFTLGIVAMINIANWFNANEMDFRNPVLFSFAVRSPLLITSRFPTAPIPQAVFVEVSPLTTPQQIVDASKQGTIPQYADDGGITPVSRDIVRMLIKNKVIETWGEQAWPQIDYVITHESNYNPYIVNKSSGACGIFQALPCSKLPSMDVTDQINWGINYIKNRYGSPANAKAHEISYNWY